MFAKKIVILLNTIKVLSYLLYKQALWGDEPQDKPIATAPSKTPGGHGAQRISTDQIGSGPLITHGGLRCR